MGTKIHFKWYFTAMDWWSYVPLLTIKEIDIEHLEHSVLEI